VSAECLDSRSHLQDPEADCHRVSGITLYPGDIIATGTPVGVGIGFKPPKYLQRGDRVRVEIDGIGAIENPVI